MYYRTFKYYISLAEATSVAEVLYQQTRGMFACFEGEVWISSSAVYRSSSLHYEVWLVTVSPSSKEEMWEACQLVGLPFLHQVEEGFLCPQLKWERIS